MLPRKENREDNRKKHYDVYHMLGLTNKPMKVTTEKTKKYFQGLPQSIFFQQLSEIKRQERNVGLQDQQYLDIWKMNFGKGR